MMFSFLESFRNCFPKSFIFLLVLFLDKVPLACNSSHAAAKIGESAHVHNIN